MKYVKKYLSFPKKLEISDRAENSRKWVNVYWYRSKKQPVGQRVVDIVGSHEYRKDVLYKDITLSNKSDVFDFYKIIKTNINRKNVVDSYDNVLNRTLVHQKQLEIAGLMQCPACTVGGEGFEFE
jgi:hypothetical protein